MKYIRYTCFTNEYCNIVLEIKDRIHELLQSLSLALIINCVLKMENTLPNKDNNL